MNDKTLTTADLLSLEHYARERSVFRQRMMAIKKNRQLSLGEHIRVIFENKDTIWYQIQEVLRIEKIFEADEIQQELDAYNPLIPSGQNLKATLMIEYSNESERKQALAKLIGIERSIYLMVAGHAQVQPICNEDLERETAEKTSSVHFMRFELTAAMIADFVKGAKTTFVVNHPHHQAEISLSADTQKALAQDFS